MAMQLLWQRVAAMKAYSLGYRTYQLFGDRLRKEVARLFAESNLSVEVTGLGSLFQIHFSNKDVVDYRTAARAHTQLRPLLHLGLINEGIFIAKRGCGNISTCITEKELNIFLPQ
jgi:glutamate-1-semialdehyde 2,1-aminomutase